MKISIIVLHYKNIGDTILCLKSIVKLSHNGLLLKTILIDNNSKIPACAGRKIQKSKLQCKIQNLTIIRNSHNLGFARGVNIGIREALKDKKTDYILILNNDTIVPADLLTMLLKQPADITSPVIKFKFENKWIYDFGGKIDWWTGRTAHFECKNAKMQECKNIGNIDYVSGCCMLVNRKVFEKIGLFDERFFFYFEDVDFCVRAKKNGLGVSVNKNAVIFHKLSGSIGRWSNRAIFYNIRSNFIFIIKYLGFRIPIGLIYLLVLSLKIIFDKFK